MHETPPNPEPEVIAPAEAAAVDAVAVVVEITPAPVAAAEAATAPATPELSPAQTSAKLKELFPALFAAMPVLPLKLRVQADIQQRAPGVFTKKALSIFLHRYTTGTPYLVAVAQAPQRADLDGAPAGEIAAEHREAAVAELARRREANAVRRAAERAAMKAQAPPAPQAQDPAPQSAQPDRPPRPPRPDRARERPQQHRQPPGDRTLDRPPGRPPERRQDRPPQRPQAQTQTQTPRPPRAEPPAPERTPQDPAQRERALLLRAFEATTLNRANFCALKRIGEAELEAALVLARQERSQR